MMSEIKYFTAEGLQKLKDELDDLILRERPKIIQAIQEARDKGDLSENAEYDAAKEAQGLLEAKIADLQDLIFNARVLDESKIDTSKVLLYSTVKLKNTKTKAVMTYSIVPEKEADFKSGKLSINSPIGQGLLGKKVGEVAEIIVPAGKMYFEILEITRQ
ncbi:MAG: transcription elongation factor GreA [Bacteroidales bacterium]|nr:transcription elongation factor GreA [Bacteroidales bacterium]